MSRADIWQFVLLLAGSCVLAYFADRATIPDPFKWMCYGVILVVWVLFLLGMRL